MNLSTVTWRQAIAAVVTTCVALVAIFVIARADGLAAVDAASGRSTGWFVHQPTGRVVLVDGYRGVALGGIDAGVEGAQIDVAEGSQGAFVLNDTTAEARAIDTVGMRLGTPFGVASLDGGRAISAVGQSGLVVVNLPGKEGTVVPPEGEPVSFDVETGSATAIGRDGAVWSLVDGDLVRTSPTSGTSTTTPLGVGDDALLSTVGSEPFVVDVERRRARFGSGGRWQDLPTEAAPSEIVAQEPGPSADCGWVASGDELWCVDADGIKLRSEVAGLDVQGSDQLAIAGDAAAVVRAAPSAIVRFDWRAGELIDEASVATDADLAVTSTVDLIWIDDRSGDHVWAVNPWSIEAVDKNDSAILVLGEDGAVVEEGDSSDGSAVGVDDSAQDDDVRKPDDNGIDDPPVAIDDSVTARAQATVNVDVTANDYDPDGEAIVIDSVGTAGHGQVEIGTAGTVVYTAEAGYVGPDSFDYTIVDGNGDEAEASVFLELLASDTTNQAPKGVPDTVETGAGVPVVIDVLLNDIDPERDPLSLGGFSPPDSLGMADTGELTETIGPSGLPALEFAPDEAFEGTVTFTYRPVDALGAVGEDVEVRVEVASSDAANRPPVVRPDAIRVRREVAATIPVLLNDSDPDGDLLTISVVGSLPSGIDVVVEGEQLAVVAGAGAPALVPFAYEVDDQHGHVVEGKVLVAVIDDDEPNKPPVVTADIAKVVAGKSLTIEVTANDTDPDDDPLTVVSVTQPEAGLGEAVVFDSNSIKFTPAEVDLDAQGLARFTYTVADGHGHEVAGDVSITILPEEPSNPPFARDDSTFTFVDVPVTVDVLRNDGDPSGGKPILVGQPGCPSGGSATITTDNKVRFDPPAGTPGAFRCTYEVTNTSRTATVDAAIIVSVRELSETNLPPIAGTDRLEVEIGETTSIDVTHNDSDPDGGAGAVLRVMSSTAPALGTAQRNGNTITFIAGTQTGTTAINYNVADAEGKVSLGRVVILVTEKKNRPPIAEPDTRIVVGPAAPTQFSVLDNDSDPDQSVDGLTVVSAAPSGVGTASVSGSLVTLTPPADFIGAMTATYTIRDADGATDSATITLIVQEPPNRAPDARDDGAEVPNGGSVTVAVLYNDIDLDGDNLTTSILSGPGAGLGSASVTSSGSIAFTATPGASGTAVIQYQISDGELTDTAFLTITVYACAQSAPVANGGALRTGYMQPLMVDLAAFGSGGDIVDVSGPPGFDPATRMYTPPAGENGNVVVSYSVVNGCRMRASGEVSIDVNQSPTAQPKAVSVQRGATRDLAVGELASDAEALQISGVTGGAGFATSTATALSLAPKADTRPGTYVLTVTVVDPGGLTVGVEVTVEVTVAAPTAQPDEITFDSARVITFNVLGNDLDPLGQGLTLRTDPPPSPVFQNGAAGTVTWTANGDVTVDPGTGHGGTTFTYTLVDGLGRTATGRVTIVGPPPPTTTTLPPTTTVPPTTVPPTTAPPTTAPPTTVATTTTTTTTEP